MRKKIEIFRFSISHPYREIMEVMTQTWKNGELTISTKTPILSRDNVELCRMEVLGIVEKKFSQIEEDADREIIGRRIGLAHAYQTLPEYGSLGFWHVVEETHKPQMLSVIFVVLINLLPMVLCMAVCAEYHTLLNLALQSVDA
jgi:hypothetical protein